MSDKDKTQELQESDNKNQIDDADLSDFDDTAAGVGVAPSASTADAEPEQAEPEKEPEIDLETLKAIAGEEEEAPPDDSVMIPKSRFDEINGKYKDVASRLDAIESERKQAQQTAAPGRDFDAEEKALADQYEAGDLAADDYHKAVRKLDRERGHAEGLGVGLQEVEKRVSAERAQAAQKAWQAKIGAWEKANADKLENAAYKDKVEELFTKFGKDPNLSDDDLIAKVEDGAQAWVAQMAKLLGVGDKPASDAPPEPKPNPHAARNARDATAQARASSSPTANVPGSAGNRATRGSLPDNVQNMSDKEIAQLLKEDGAAKDIADF